MRFLKNLAIVFALLAASNCYAEVVNKIIVEGTQRVEQDTVKAYLDVLPGVNFNQEQIDSSLKKLYGSNLFYKVDIFTKGNTLFVKVQENPKINLVVFEGNSKVKTKDLEAEISTKPRSIYTKARVQDDVNKIIDLYNKNGRYSVKVIPQIIELPQNRVDLIFKIEEGPQAKIEKIIFVGNKAFSERRLRSEISSRETHWYMFLSSSDQYNPSRIEYDRELLTRFYQSKGYAEFKIISVITTVSEDKKSFYITYTIDEGEKYYLQKVDLVSHLKSENIDLNELKKDIYVKSGEVFNIKLIEKSIDKMIKDVNDLGFAFVDIYPDMMINEKNKTIDLTFTIGESRRVYINKINITGNVRTSDKVIRREFRLAEGDPYNATKIQRSDTRINNLDYFEPTKIDTERTSEPDKVNLNLNVQEKSTASISLAGGYSTSDGPVGKLGFTENNLFGNGQILDTMVAKSKDRLDFDLGFTEPYLFDRTLSGGFDLYSHNTDRNDSQYRYYDQSVNGGSLRILYSITEYLKHSLYYRLSFTDIDNVSSSASSWVQNQAGRHVTSLIGQGFIYDKRDSASTPTEGYFIGFNQEYAGVGGNTYFLRHTAKARYYYPVKDDDVILAFGIEGGNIVGLRGQEINLSNRFFLGGSGSIRGFDFNGVGPRTKNTLEPVGGQTYYDGTVELKFPLGFGKDVGVFGATFIDAGSLFGADVPSDQTANVWDDKKIRSSYGVGIGLITPMGPIRVNYSIPMSKESYDQTKYFDIEFKTSL